MGCRGLNLGRPHARQASASPPALSGMTLLSSEKQTSTLPPFPTEASCPSIPDARTGTLSKAWSALPEPWSNRGPARRAQGRKRGDDTPEEGFWETRLKQRPHHRCHPSHRPLFTSLPTLLLVHSCPGSLTSRRRHPARETGPSPA